MQKTLILMKPDAISRGLVGAILARFEAAGLRVKDGRFAQPDLSQLQAHYADLKDRNPLAFQRTTESLSGHPFLALVLAGTNAIQKVRSLTGPTDPGTAPAGTIRGDFGADLMALADQENRATFNLIHASDSEESVAREIAVWFPPR